MGTFGMLRSSKMLRRIHLSELWKKDALMKKVDGTPAIRECALDGKTRLNASAFNPMTLADERCKAYTRSMFKKMGVALSGGHDATGEDDDDENEGAGKGGGGGEGLESGEEGNVKFSTPAARPTRAISRRS